MSGYLGKTQNSPPKQIKELGNPSSFVEAPGLGRR